MKQRDEFHHDTIVSDGEKEFFFERKLFVLSSREKVFKAYFPDFFYLCVKYIFILSRWPSGMNSKKFLKRSGHNSSERLSMWFLRVMGKIWKTLKEIFHFFSQYFSM